MMKKLYHHYLIYKYNFTFSLVCTTIVHSVAEWCRCGKCGATDKNVECLCCQEVEAIIHVELLGMRYDDMSAVT